MLYAYARVSTDDQSLASQDAELKAAGCGRIYAEKISIAYPLEFFDESIIGRNRLFNRNVIGLVEANGLQYFAANILH